MPNPENSLRNRLLNQYVPEPGKLAKYREEVQAMLEREERWLRYQSWYSAAVWLWAVFLATAFALVAGYSREQSNKVYFSIGVTILMLSVFGAVSLIGTIVNRARLQVQKDVKSVELRLLALEELLRGDDK